MLKCPVCQCSYKEEVNICKECNLSEENIIHINEISPDNPILQICIPTLVKKLNEYKKTYYQNQLISNIKKLDTKVRIIETEQKEDRQKVKDLEKIVIELKFQIQSKDNYYNINSDIQENFKPSTYPQSSTLIGHTPIHFNSGDVGNVELINQNNMVSTQNDLKYNNFSNIEDSNNSAFFKNPDCQADNNSNELLDSQESHLDNETDQDKFCQAIDTQIPHFVEEYNMDKNSFDQRAISTVIETKESMATRLAGYSKVIFLSNTSKGNYWIVEENNYYYLVPHAKININEHNKYTVENLFNCDESSSGDYNFKLIRPAKILKFDSETWQLEKKGKLEFF